MFTKELQQLFEDRVNLEKTTFVGKTMVTDIGNGLLAKVEFITTTMHDQYDALRVTIIAKTRGPVDSIRVSFVDVWGLKNGDRIPHIWQDRWFVYTPSKEEYCLLADAVMDYITLFTEMENKA